MRRRATPGRSRLPFLFDTVVQFGEGRVSHGGECPDGYGSLHPTLTWSEWVAWRWWVGGILERIDRAAHFVPIVRSAWCPRICDRLVGDRGPWSPIRYGSVSVPWEDSPQGQPDPDCGANLEPTPSRASCR